MAAPVPGASGQNLQNLIRPEQVARLPHLSAQQKQETQFKVSKLWEYIHNNGANPNDPNYQKASSTLSQMSANLMNGMKKFREMQAQSQQRGGPPNAQGMSMPPQQQVQQAQQPTAAAPQQQPQPQPQPSSGAVTFAQLQPEVQARVNQQTFCFPPAMTEGTPHANQWLQEAKARYGQAIQRAQMAKGKKTDLQRAAHVRQQQGNPLTPEEQNGLNAKLAQCDKAIRESQSFMEKFKEQQEQFRNARPQQRFSQPTGPQAVAGSESQSEGPPAAIQQAQPGAGPQPLSIASAQAAARANGTNTITAPGAVQPPGIGTPGTQQTPLDNINQQNTIMTQPSQSRPTTAAGPGPQSNIHPSVQNSMQASHAHPNAVNTNPLNAVNGMKAHPPPIPKNLQVSEPTSVQIPPSRPTLNGGANVGLPGQLAQPALTTFPGYVLEQSEDGHLLSKKRLQDLLREVLGTNAEDQLTPDAEEVSLNLALQASKLILPALTLDRR